MGRTTEVTPPLVYSDAARRIIDEETLGVEGVARRDARKARWRRMWEIVRFVLLVAAGMLFCSLFLSPLAGVALFVVVVVVNAINHASKKISEDFRVAIAEFEDRRLIYDKDIYKAIEKLEDGQSFIDEMREKSDEVAIEKIRAMYDVALRLRSFPDADDWLPDMPAAQKPDAGAELESRK